MIPGFVKCFYFEIICVLVCLRAVNNPKYKHKAPAVPYFVMNTIRSYRTVTSFRFIPQKSVVCPSSAEDIRLSNSGSDSE